MMLPAYNPLARLGAVIQYNADDPPDAEQIAFLKARGDTIELVDRTQHNQALDFDYQSDPYLAGGGNPLYADPANIPQPPRAQLLDCHPRNAECVAANQLAAATEQTLWAAYQQAQRGAYDPTAPDRYVALLNTYAQTGSLPASVMQASAAQPMGAPPATRVARATYTPPPTTKTPTQGTTTAAKSIRTPPAFQPKVTNGGQTEPLIPETPQPDENQIVSGVPNWALLAGAAGAAFLLLGGQRR